MKFGICPHILTSRCWETNHTLEMNARTASRILQVKSCKIMISHFVLTNFSLTYPEAFSRAWDKPQDVGIHTSVLLSLPFNSPGCIMLSINWAQTQHFHVFGISLPCSSPVQQTHLLSKGPRGKTILWEATSCPQGKSFKVLLKCFCVYLHKQSSYYKINII